MEDAGLCEPAELSGSHEGFMPISPGGGGEEEKGPSPVLPLGVGAYGTALLPMDNLVEAEADESDEDEPEEEVEDDEPLETAPGEVRLVPSLFRGRAPTIFFEYPENLRLTRRAMPHFVEPLGRGRRLVYKCHWERNCIKNAFTRAGFERLTGSGHSGHWNAVWAKHPTTQAFNELTIWQKVNHFPGSWCIGRKDRLMRCLTRARRRHPQEYDFFPDGFILPGEYHSWYRKAKGHKSWIWICKPLASSCGKGIKLIHKGNLNTIKPDKKCLMQRYIHEPYLIDGRKFDLRVYVLVTDVDPLKVYIFDEGLARFSTHKYTLKNLKSRFAHLTNYSINKKSKHYVKTQDEDDMASGHKWSLKALLDKIEELEGPAGRRKADEGIRSVILKTMIAAEAEMGPQVQQKVRHRGCCFELFGFDIMLDSRLKAWIIEVNISPSLMGGAAIDRKIKGTLMADIFHTVGYVPYDKAAVKRQAVQRELERDSRLSGIVSDEFEPCQASLVKLRSNTSQRLQAQPSWRREQDPRSIDPQCFSPEDWDVVMDFEDEYCRRGHFELLYPRVDNVAKHINMFATPRLNNHLLAHWLLYQRSTSLLSLLADPADVRIEALRETIVIQQPAARPHRNPKSRGRAGSRRGAKEHRPKSTPMPPRGAEPPARRGNKDPASGTARRGRDSPLTSASDQSLVPPVHTQQQRQGAPARRDARQRVHESRSLVAHPTDGLGVEYHYYDAPQERRSSFGKGNGTFQAFPAGGGARAAANLRAPPSQPTDEDKRAVYATLAHELRRLTPEELQVLMRHLEGIQASRGQQSGDVDITASARVAGVAASMAGQARGHPERDLRNVEASFQTLSLEQQSAFSPRINNRFASFAHRVSASGGSAAPGVANGVAAAATGAGGGIAVSGITGVGGRGGGGGDRPRGANPYGAAALRGTRGIDSFQDHFLNTMNGGNLY